MSFNVMKAHKYSAEKIKDWSHVTIEPKLDGIRVIVTVDSEMKITYFSRNGNALDMFTHLDNKVLRLRRYLTKMDSNYEYGMMMDGEMVADSAKFGDISGAIHRKNHTADYARLLCFHVMPLAQFEAGEDNAPALQRTVQLAKCLARMDQDLIRYNAPAYVTSDSEAKKAYGKFREQNVEGAMIKDLSLPWVGKRSNAWLKMKPTETEDVIVASFIPGKGKYKGKLGSLLCHRVLKNGKLGAQVRAGGMTDALRNLWSRKPHLILGKMIEVEFHEPTDSTKLRHPRFKRVRTDKQGETSK